MITHIFVGFVNVPGYNLIRSACSCGWRSGTYGGDMAKVAAKTAYVRHQTEWFKTL